MHRRGDGRTRPGYVRGPHGIASVEDRPDHGRQFQDIVGFTIGADVLPHHHAAHGLHRRAAGGCIVPGGRLEQAGAAGDRVCVRAGDRVEEGGKDISCKKWSLL